MNVWNSVATVLFQFIRAVEQIITYIQILDFALDVISMFHFYFYTSFGGGFFWQ